MNSTAEGEGATGAPSPPPGADGNVRLRKAGNEIISLMGAPDKPKAAVLLAAEGFAEAGETAQSRKIAL